MVVPMNVDEQIHIWEKEKFRLSDSPAYLYDDFESAIAFNSAVEHAANIQALSWTDAVKMRFTVHAFGHESMKQYFKDCKKLSNETKRQKLY